VADRVVTCSPDSDRGHDRLLDSVSVEPVTIGREELLVGKLGAAISWIDAGQISNQRTVTETWFA